MSEKEKLPYGLDESEALMLENFVKGPGWAVMNKIVKIEVDKLKSCLATENSVDEIRRLQGRITGTTAILAIPFSIVSSQLRKKSKS